MSNIKYQISNIRFIDIILLLIIFVIPLKTQAITVTEKQATVYAQNDPSMSLEIPADTFKKPADVKLCKLSESGTPSVDWDINNLSDVYFLEVFDEETKEPRNYFRKELVLKIPVYSEDDLSDELVVFFWDREAKTWIATDGEILDQGKNIVTGKINYTGYFTVMEKNYNGTWPDYFKYTAVSFVGLGLIIILALWYNEKRKAKDKKRKVK